MLSHGISEKRETDGASERRAAHLLTQVTVEAAVVGSGAEDSESILESPSSSVRARLQNLWLTLVWKIVGSSVDGRSCNSAPKKFSSARIGQEAATLTSRDRVTFPDHHLFSTKVQYPISGEQRECLFTTPC